MPSFINWSNCKKYILEHAVRTRSHKFTRVSGGVKEYLEASIRSDMINLIRQHPGVGKTISTGVTRYEKPNGDSSP